MAEGGILDRGRCLSRENPEYSEPKLILYRYGLHSVSYTKPMTHSHSLTHLLQAETIYFMKSFDFDCTSENNDPKVSSSPLVTVLLYILWCNIFYINIETISAEFVPCVTD